MGFFAVAEISESAKLDAEVILLHVIHKQRSYLYTWPDDRLNGEQIDSFTQMVSRRALGTPIAHIVGGARVLVVTLYGQSQYAHPTT